MGKNTDNLMHEMLKYLSQIDYVHPEDIPDIDLYMDQVTTFIDQHLSSTKRYPSDKLLTKSMINNYAKNNLLPPPQKKKYNKEHILTLAFIYYFKNILSITDIQRMLRPLTDKYFGNTEDLSLEDVYTSIFDQKYPIIHDLAKDLRKKEELSKDALSKIENLDQVSDKEQDFLKTFAFICMLASDVYLKKLMIEHLIDKLPT